MKTNRNLFSAIILMLVTALFSCNSGNNDKTSPQEITVGDLQYKLTESSFGTNVTDNNKLDTSGGYYLMAELTIANTNNNPVKFDSTHFKLTNSSGKTFPFSGEKAAFFKNFKESLNGTTINGKSEKSGFIIFTVPGIGNYQLHFSDGDWAKRDKILELKH